MNDDIPHNPMLDLQIWCDARGLDLPIYKRMELTTGFMKCEWWSVELAGANGDRIFYYGMF